MFTFFKTCFRRETRPEYIMDSLYYDMLNYNIKNQRRTTFHYRQYRASYLSSLLLKYARIYYNGTYDVKEKTLKKLVAELYVHYSSIKSKSSTIRSSLKKAITDILQIDRNANTDLIKSEVSKFTCYDVKKLDPYADIITKIEEKYSPHPITCAWQGGGATVDYLLKGGGGISTMDNIFGFISGYIESIISPKKSSILDTNPTNTI